MTRAQIVALVVGLGAVLVIIEFVRRQALRVKYAGLWLIVGVAIAVLGAAPGLLDGAAELLQVADPPNLLFFVAILVLLGVIIQLSLELSRLEEKLRILAEHVAMLELHTDIGSGSPGLGHDTSATSGPDLSTEAVSNPPTDT